MRPLHRVSQELKFAFTQNTQINSLFLHTEVTQKSGSAETEEFLAMKTNLLLPWLREDHAWGWLHLSPCWGTAPTSSAPVTEYACPFTSFCDVTASVSAALVICKSKEAITTLDWCDL